MKFDGIKINDFPLQKQDTNTCGNFVIYYICSRFFNGIVMYFILITLKVKNGFFSEDLDYKTFLENIFYTDDLDKNEEIVKEFVVSI